MLKKNLKVYKNFEKKIITINIHILKHSFNKKYFYIETLKKITLYI